MDPPGTHHRNIGSVRGCSFEVDIIGFRVTHLGNVEIHNSRPLEIDVIESCTSLFRYLDVDWSALDPS